MRLTFYFQPVRDLALAVEHYRGLGWEEAWREGEHTVAMQMPDTEVQLMLDDAEGWGPAGPMYLVDDIITWLAAHPTLGTKSISEIPGGYVLEIMAPGHGYYVFSMNRPA